MTKTGDVKTFYIAKKIDNWLDYMESQARGE
nr:MAG TPA: hypothetical protein [Caudoviricetes sp.]